MMVPPQVNPAYHHPEATGRQWVDNLLHDHSRCFDNFRMELETFRCLHYILCNGYGLASTRELDSWEALGMYLWACGIGQSQRQMKERFQRGLGTCSKIFSLVLSTMVPFANAVLRPKDYTYAIVPHKLTKYTTFLIAA